MQGEWSKNVHIGHNVVDRNGNSIGVIRNLQEVSRAAGGPQASGPGCIEVECTLPDLPKNLYIPLDSLQDCTGDRCRLNLTRDEIKNRGWDQRPSNF